MDEKTIKLIATYLTAAARLKASGLLADLEADVDALVAKVRAKVPATKPDGSPWTDADLEALAADAHANNAATMARSAAEGDAPQQ